ncbi:MAG: DNA methyltransferase [Candidatus Thorarchaeota archaeon]
MRNPVKVNLGIDGATKRFFEFITQPIKLSTIIPLKNLINLSQDENLTKFWITLLQKNLECFQLVCGEIGLTIDVFYIDLETPVIFQPLLNNSITLEIGQKFSLMVKNIKSNLLNYYNQEIESLFIQIKRDSNQKGVFYYTYKLEDQNIKPLWRPRTPRSKIKGINKTELDQNKIITLKNRKKRFPVGQRNLKNRLNLLTGREWIKFTKTWFIHRPPSRSNEELLHPAKFPETMIRQFITFFTKPSDLVLDPFLGTGSTLIAAKRSNRSGLGIEISSEYAEISKQRIENITIPAYPPIYQTRESNFWHVICGDSRDLVEYLDEYDLSTIDFCITSPPYWSQLERNSIRQKQRKDMGLDTKYSNEDPRDLGNLDDYQDFIREQQMIFGNVFKLLRPKGYLVIITNNVFANGRVYPLAYDTVQSLIHDKDHPWILKDEKLWLQDDKALVALGVNYAWVGNRCHQYCLILRKESSS